LALIKCVECGSGVSDNAAACPKCGSPLRKSKGGGGKLLGSVALTMVVLVVATSTIHWCDANRPKSSESQPTAPDTSAALHDSAVAHSVVGPVTLEAAPVTTTNRPVIAGTTNLPDGTELMLTVSRKRSGYMGEAKVRILSGRFETKPFTNGDLPLLPGTYILEIGTPLEEFQPSVVQSVVGVHYSNLSGPLVKHGPYGTVVEYETSFKVPGTSEAQKDSAARDATIKEVHEWTRKSCLEIPNSVERLSGEKLDAAKRQEIIESCLKDLDADERK